MFRRSVTVTLDTESAAFRMEEDESLNRIEVAALLKRAAHEIDMGRDSGSLRDHNGVAVGSFTVIEKEA